MCLICKDAMLAQSKNIDWDDAQKEWCCDGELEIDSKCYCGVNIKTEYYISNKNTKVTFKLGSICINTIFDKTISKKLLGKVNSIFCDDCETLIKKCSYKQHLKSKKHKANAGIAEELKRCIDCKEFKLEKESWKTKCKDCYAFSKGYRLCHGCMKYNIKVDSTFRECFKCHSSHTNLFKLEF